MYAELLKPYQCRHLNPISFIVSFHVLVLLNIPIYRAQINYEQYYSDCSNMSAVRCGNKTFKNPEYPFWGQNIRFNHCGLEGFELRCEANDLVIDIGPNSTYRVLETNPPRSLITLKYYDDPLGNICASQDVSSRVLNETLYDYGENTKVLNLFYNCDDEIVSPRIDYKLVCPSDNKNLVYFFLGNSFYLVEEDKLDSCNKTTLQVDKMVFEDLKNYRIHPEELFQKSFEVHYNGMNEKACTDCKATGGWCWSGTTVKNNTCLYNNGTVLPPYPQPGLLKLFTLL
ncbi:hypothetical protein POM88_003879 [Heracleum sosnowskyi]|uniref:non-specific serine/threonine protein kinase n=1 Tax=Heracleum sosnowskyi TaxID=360622 RepID=A0AAD8JHD7_9APIA|nr:hypothetical protein POM88_003879 [Heracleum sosnowskyi]